MEAPHQDAQIVAKLEETIRQISETIGSLKGQYAQGEPDAKVERKYFASQLNAYKRALSNWDRGLRPRAFGNGYLVPSGSTPGKAPYYVERRGGVWVCDPTCPHCGETHWHTAIVAVLEQAREQSDDGEVVVHEPVGAPAAPGANPSGPDDWQVPDYDEPWLPSHTARAGDSESPAPALVVPVADRIGRARRRALELAAQPPPTAWAGRKPRAPGRRADPQPSHRHDAAALLSTLELDSELKTNRTRNRLEPDSKPNISEQPRGLR